MTCVLFVVVCVLFIVGCAVILGIGVSFFAGWASNRPSTTSAAEPATTQFLVAYDMGAGRRASVTLKARSFNEAFDLAISPRKHAWNVSVTRHQ